MVNIQLRYIWAAIAFFLFVGFLFLNQWVLKGVEEIKTVSPAVAPVAPPKVKSLPTGGKLTHTMYLDANRKFYVNTFYVDGQEVAQCKSEEDRVFDVTGRIPDGKFQFTNQTDKTFGEERFLKGKRYGEYKEYYEEGKLKTEKIYQYGAVQVLKQYYIDGILRMEQDLTDAIAGVDNKETGIGKVYYRNGTLMYEWRLTNKDKGGYNKSYNKDGRLVAVNYLDEMGRRIERQNPALK